MKIFCPINFPSFCFFCFLGNASEVQDGVSLMGLDPYTLHLATLSTTGLSQYIQSPMNLPLMVEVIHGDSARICPSSLP